MQAIIANIEQRRIINELIRVKEDMVKLENLKKKLENQLPDLVCSQNTDKTWVRYKKVDNLQELESKGKVFHQSYFNRFTSKIDILKNMPRELK